MKWWNYMKNGEPRRAGRPPVVEEREWKPDDEIPAVPSKVPLARYNRAERQQLMEQAVSMLESGISRAAISQVLRVRMTDLPKAEGIRRAS